MVPDEEDAANAGAPDYPESGGDALRAHSSVLRSVLATATQGIGAFDRQRRLVAWNDNYQRILKLPDELMVLGRDLEDLSMHLARRGDYGQGDPRVLAEQRIEALTAGRTLRSEVSILDDRIYDALVQPMPEGGFVITYTDITERKRAEEAQRAILDSIPQPLVVVSRVTGRYLYCNEPARLTFAGPDADMVGLPATEQYRNTEDRARLVELMDRQGYVDNFEATFRRADGGDFPALISSRSMMFQDEAAILSSWNDITAIKFAQTQIEKARDEAEQANQTKSDFLANMSHEIRTPMNAIIGMSYLALKTRLDPTQRNYVVKIHRSAESLLGIINDILDFSKIDAGKMEMESIEFRLEDVLDNLANLVGMKASEKGLELLFDTNPATPMALIGDPLRLGQVLINLGNNAVKFTRAGEVVVRTQVRSRDAGHAMLHFSVRDTGVGITQAQRSKLFQSFSQADGSVTREFGGSGLGLAISKRLTEMMGGEIWMESAPGQGSTFHFTARFALQASMAAPGRREAAPDLADLRLLVVDDNATAREILATMAETFGFRATSMPDGDHALEELEVAAAAGDPYRMVLMDWRMPGMDGVQTARALQENEALGHPPTVIMVSAYGREELLKATADLKLGGCLTKPVSPSTMLDSIMHACGHAASDGNRSLLWRDEGLEAAQSLRGAHVLLVEDNEVNQELALELLSGAGVSVEVAGNGREALALLEVNEYDGVLMDVQMPEMDGYTATREIRKRESLRDLPVIAMTANAMIGDRARALDAGMNDHIAKPINVGELFATMARWVTPSRQDAAPEVRAKQAKQADEEGAALPALEGVNTASGLARCAGNGALYRRLLVRFRDTHREFVGEFSKLREGGDLEAVTRHAHTLKGVAANLGVEDVSAAAGELEAACADTVAGARVDRALARLAGALQPVMGALRALDAPGRQTPAAGPDGEAADVNGLLTRLRALLDDSDADALELFQSLCAHPALTESAAEMELLAAHIEVFEFGEALRALDALERSLD